MCARRTQKKDLSAPQTTFTFEMEVDGTPMRLDAFLATRMPWRSRSFFQTMIKRGEVRVNGAHRRASRMITPGDRVDVYVERYQDIPEDITPATLSVVYEDEDILVANKQPGDLVHPTGPHLYTTLMNTVHARYAGASYLPQSVHRLDKDTSGVLLIAKEDAIRRWLGCEIERRAVEKTYLALVHGVCAASSGEMCEPLGDCRYSHIRIKQWINESEGMPSRTLYTVLGRAPVVSGMPHGVSLLCVRIITGRTHQIRIHLAARGHSIIGDKLYGNGPETCADIAVHTHMLHAWHMRVRPSATRPYMRFCAPPPPFFSSCLETIFGRSFVQSLVLPAATECDE